MKSTITIEHDVQDGIYYLTEDDNRLLGFESEEELKKHFSSLDFSGDTITVKDKDLFLAQAIFV